ncbi:MAG: sigma-70 family RNA polymerase sigma factor [Chloroflexi bacterium]|nr:sigma-70 family RNA polymerase sigma factor [Chloroflexota bacterium]
MELDLVERARAGDVEAFTSLMENRFEQMFRTAMAILGNEADARDATQEAVTAMWQGLPGLRQPASFDGWSRRIILNACRMRLRRRRTAGGREISLALFGAGLAPGGSSSRPGPSDQIVHKDLLERAFERLNAHERTVLVLHHLEDRPLSDVSLLLGVPVGTVKSRLHAARKSLERALERESR